MKKKKVYFVEGTFYPSKSPTNSRRKKKKIKTKKDEYIRFLENKLKKKNIPVTKKESLQLRVGRIEKILKRYDGRFSKMKEVVEATQKLIEEQDRFFKKKGFDQERIYEYIDRKLLDLELEERAKRENGVDIKEKNNGEKVDFENKLNSSESRRSRLFEKTIPEFQFQLDKIKSSSISRRDIAEMETKIEKLRNICSRFNSEINGLRNVNMKREETMKTEIESSIREDLRKEMKDYVQSLYSELHEKLLKKCDGIRDKIREEIIALLRSGQGRKQKRGMKKKRVKKNGRELRLKELYAEVASLELEEIHEKERKTD